jgi:hypothetical protein
VCCRKVQQGSSLPPPQAVLLQQRPPQQLHLSLLQPLPHHLAAACQMYQQLHHWHHQQLHPQVLC